MAAANSDYPNRDALLARLALRLSEGGRLIAAVAGILLVACIAGALTVLGALLILLAFAAAVILLPLARATPVEAPAQAAPTASLDAGARHVADALPDPCFILDRRGVVRYANERATATFQIRAGDALTFRLRVPDLVAAFDRVAKGGGPPERIEFSERVPTERWFAAWFARLETSDLIVLLIDDMSERKNADRVRVDFVANASHELRTPLASLAGFIETLQGPAREDTAARDRFLGIMREQAERMSRLVNDLLSLSRIEMKAHVRPSDSIDLVAIVNHVVDALEPLARDLDVTIETETPPGAVQVIGDGDELTQVFENLIENACKYGQSGKRVVVTVAADDRGAPRVIVRDFGPGIPAEHQPRLTERFYRVDLEASRRHRGTGLGLAIVKHILARHRARMAVESRLGEGATFTVTFPQAPAGRSPTSGEKAQDNQAIGLS